MSQAVEGSTSVELEEPLLMDTVDREEQLTEDSVKEKKNISGCLRVCSRLVVSRLERTMYRLGLQIGEHPFAVVGAVLVITTICSLGLLKFKIVTDFKEQWVPKESLVDIAWMDQNLPYESYRAENMMITSDNVLSPNVLKAMLDLHLKIININMSGVSWNDNCLKPFGSRCYASSILELWSFEETIISNLTEKSILEKINQEFLINPIYFTKVNVKGILGGLTRDEKGLIIGAKAAFVTYCLLEGNMLDKVSQSQLENKFIEIGMSANYKNVENIYIYTGSSYKKESSNAINKDAPQGISAAVPILIYLIIMLGKLNRLENKIVLSLMGIICIGLSAITSFGLCAACDFSYGPIHSLLFLLILGIGVDDMFVIVQAWENANKKSKEGLIKEKIGLTLKDAGVSITVTSLTDVAAFVVGSSFNLPAVRSFCLYAGVTIFFLFFYTITFFAACLVIDAKRVQASRDALIFCCKLGSDYTPSQCSQANYLQNFFSKVYAPWLLKTPSKILVIILTFSIFGAGIYGTAHLKGDSDLTKFLPSDSYLYSFIQTTKEYFPNHLLVTGFVYMRGVDYYSEYKTVHQLYTDLEKSEYVKNETLKSWFEEFRKWMVVNKKGSGFLDSDGMPTSETIFYTWLKEYLYHTIGGLEFYNDVKFNSTENKVSASRIKFTLVNLSSTPENFKAMANVRKVATNANFILNDASFAFSTMFLQWDAIEAVNKNIFRNCGILTATVFLVILVLTANFWCSALIILSLCFTLVDITGFMYFWGLSIDTVTSTVILLAIGYSVDHSTHITIAFVKETGGKNERGIKAIGAVAPAVFNAGFSTILATLPAVASSSYIFTAAFKLVFLMTTFGLFHGIVLMPVILSWFGPNSHSVVDKQKPAPEEKISNNSLCPLPTYTATVQNSKKEVFKFPT